MIWFGLVPFKTSDPTCGSVPSVKLLETSTKLDHRDCVRARALVHLIPGHRLVNMIIIWSSYDYCFIIIIIIFDHLTSLLNKCDVELAGIVRAAGGSLKHIWLLCFSWILSLKSFFLLIWFERIFTDAREVLPFVEGQESWCLIGNMIGPRIFGL